MIQIMMNDGPRYTFESATLQRPCTSSHRVFAREVL